MIEVRNRKANFDYNIEETYEAGIVLTGTEIKSIRRGNVDLKDSFAKVKNGEIYLMNMYIATYDEGNIFNHEERRTRKLLMHKKEIKKLDIKTNQDGFSLVTLKLYSKRGKIKILIGLGKGKKLYDKRRAIKEKDIKLKESKEFSNYNKA